MILLSNGMHTNCDLPGIASKCPKDSNNTHLHKSLLAKFIEFMSTLCQKQPLISVKICYLDAFYENNWHFVPVFDT